MAGMLTLKERLMVLWVCKQKQLHPGNNGKYGALDETALKGMFERLFFGTYKCLAKLEGHTHGVLCLALYGNKLFSAGGYGGDRTIRVWNADTHEHLATMKGHTDRVVCLTLYGNKLFSGGGHGDRTIRVWDADTHEHLATMEGHTRFVECLTLYGNKLFSGGGAYGDGTIRVWNVKED